MLKYIFKKISNSCTWLKTPEYGKAHRENDQYLSLTSRVATPTLSCLSGKTSVSKNTSLQFLVLSCCSGWKLSSSSGLIPPLVCNIVISLFFALLMVTFVPQSDSLKPLFSTEYRRELLHVYLGCWRAPSFLWPFSTPSPSGFSQLQSCVQSVKADHI